MVADPGVDRSRGLAARRRLFQGGPGEAWQRRLSTASQSLLDWIQRPDAACLVCRGSLLVRSVDRRNCASTCPGFAVGYLLIARRRRTDVSGLSVGHAVLGNDCLFNPVRTAWLAD